MADIKHDKWYIELQARKAEREKNEKQLKDIAKEFPYRARKTATPTKRKYERASSEEAFTPSQSIAEMQAQSMTNLRKRAMPPIRREYER